MSDNLKTIIKNIKNYKMKTVHTDLERRQYLTEQTTQTLMLAKTYTLKPQAAYLVVSGIEDDVQPSWSKERIERYCLELRPKLEKMKSAAEAQKEDIFKQIAEEQAKKNS